MAPETDTQPDPAGESAGSDRPSVEAIDWEALDSGANAITPKRAAWWTLFGAWALGVAVDVYSRFVGAGEPFEFPTVGIIDPLDWLYSVTLLALVFFVLLPLYENRRMTIYYWRQFRKNKAAVVSLGWIGIIFLIGTVVPRFLEPPTVQPLDSYQPPVFGTVDSLVPIACKGEVVDTLCHGTWAHPFGTTHQGKDILVSVIYGMEISMQVGLIGTLIIIVIAAAVGISAAYFGGWVDEVLMRYVDIQITFPTFFLYLLVVYLFGSSLFYMIVIFGLLGWGGIARIVRSEALQRREEEYVLAAKSAGASGGWTMRRHLLPNVSNSVITAATLLIPSLILFEAALAFLSLGDPTIPSWGEVIADGRNDISDAWWISTIPGVFLFFTILAFNFVGDALRDALDPRAEGSE